MPTSTPLTHSCAHLECASTTRVDSAAWSKHWRSANKEVFWPTGPGVSWGARDHEPKICHECYNEKLALQQSLQGQMQTRQGPAIPDPPREKAARRGEIQSLGEASTCATPVALGPGTAPSAESTEGGSEAGGGPADAARLPPALEPKVDPRQSYPCPFND